MNVVCIELSTDELDESVPSDLQTDPMQSVPSVRATKREETCSRMYKKMKMAIHKQTEDLCKPLDSRVAEY